MGKSLPDDNLIITSDVGTILILNNQNEEVTECIKCGKCSEVCPVNLIPSLIIKSKDNALKYNINKCTKCGLCSYVCPAKIEIKDIIKKMKEEIKWVNII